jgi:pimeloyl-ACP methyl ester carboxylesterase
MTEYSFVWIPLAEKLAKEGYRVISYDLYGRGYSDAPPMAYDERVFVSQLSHLLIRLNLGETPINLVGLSLGGGVSVAFTSLFPHNVKRLILLASVGFPFELPLISKVMKLPILAELVCYYFGVQLLKPRATAAFPYPERFLPQIQQLQNAYQFQSEINPNYNLAIGATIRDFPFGELIHHFQEVGKTKRPTLLLWGEKDKTVPIAQAHEIQNTIPGSTLVSLPDCGHAILQSHIEEVFSEIFKFMQNNK